MNTIQEILSAVATKEITAEEGAALIANLGKKPKGIRLEVSEKGAVKIVGMRQRFPIVLYPNEVEVILGMADKFVLFIEENRSKLSFKKGDITAPEKPAEQQAA